MEKDNKLKVQMKINKKRSQRKERYCMYNQIKIQLCLFKKNQMRAYVRRFDCTKSSSGKGTSALSGCSAWNEAMTACAPFYTFCSVLFEKAIEYSVFLFFGF